MDCCTNGWSHLFDKLVDARYIHVFYKRLGTWNFDIVMFLLSYGMATYSIFHIKSLVENSYNRVVRMHGDPSRIYEGLQAVVAHSTFTLRA